MALAFWVQNPSSLSKAFAAHDEYLAIFSHFISNGDNTMLTPHDDYYTAPFCFMPSNNNNNDKTNHSPKSGFLVFTMQVPWLHGNPFYEEEEGGRGRAHSRALAWMKERGEMTPPILGTVEEFQKKLCLNDEGGLFTFTRDGCYPAVEDVSQALEDRAVEVTCTALGWKIPEDWRALRKEVNLHNVPILDLADWDKRGKTVNSNDEANNDDSVNDNSANSNSPNDNAKVTKCNEHGHGQEEKKDSAEEYQC